MGRFIVRRSIGVVVLLIIVSMATFGIFFLAPKLVGTDPARLFAGRVADDATVKQVTKKLGLDQPLYIQYARYAMASSPAATSTTAPTRPIATSPAWATRSRTTRTSGP